MQPYLYLIGIILIQWILLFPNNKVTFNKKIGIKQKKIFLVLTCIELIIFTGLRATNIGADTTVYLSALNYYKALPHNEILGAKLVYPFDFEIGYFVFTKICAFISLSETAFLNVIAIIIYVPIFKFIYDYSENPLISLLVYFAFGCFEYSLGVFRQMIALSICVTGFKHVMNRNFLKYLFYIIFAMMFHTTAIIALPIYWIKNINLSNKLSVFFTTEIFFILFSRSFVTLSIKVFSKYSGYINGKYDISGGSYTMLILLNIIFIFAYYKYYMKKEKIDNVTDMSIKSIMIAILLQILGYSMGIFGRIVPYYSIYLVILIPGLIKVLMRKNTILVHFCSVFILVFIFYILTKNGVNLNPYRFIWSA